MKSNGVKVSVILPYRNSEKFLYKSIYSIVHQDFDDFELILIDDNSKDGSTHIASSFDDKRIKIVKQIDKSGEAAARDLGISIAKGEYICITSSDNICFPNRLNRQFQYLKNHQEVGAVTSNAVAVDENDYPLSILKRPVKSNDFYMAALLVDNCFIHSSLMFRKHLIEKYQIRYTGNSTYAFDYAFMISLCKKINIRNIDEYLVLLRKHDLQHSVIFSKEKDFSKKVIKRQLLEELLPVMNEYQLKSALRLLDINYKLSQEEMAYCSELLTELLQANKTKRIFNEIELVKLWNNLIIYKKRML